MLPEGRAMGKITLDAATTAALKQAALGAELVGPDGQPVGHFVPPSLTTLWERTLEEDRRETAAAADAEVTHEELEAAFQTGGEIPMAEVFKLLEKHGG